jgi:hypothetical protein
MKLELFVLLCISAGASVVEAQTTTAVTTTTRRVSAPEIEWAAAGSALTLLAGAVAIVRGRRRG